jgi:putative ABC transport system ATP-binding protein
VTGNESPAARAEDVWKIYGSGDAEVTARREVDVSLRKGAFTVFMGPSGSGRSTLMHDAVIGRMRRPDVTS